MCNLLSGTGKKAQPANISISTAHCVLQTTGELPAFSIYMLGKGHRLILAHSAVTVCRGIVFPGRSNGAVMLLDYSGDDLYNKLRSQRNSHQMQWFLHARSSGGPLASVAHLVEHRIL